MGSRSEFRQRAPVDLNHSVVMRGLDPGLVPGILPVIPTTAWRL
jgi:hypothetical protein